MNSDQRYVLVRIRSKIVKQKLGLLTLAAAAILVGTSPIIAEPLAKNSSSQSTSSVPTTKYKGATIPDFRLITFGSLVGVNDSGSFKIPGQGTISFSPGDKPVDILTLGSIKDLGADKLDLGTISKLTGIDLGTKTLADFPLLSTQSISDLAKAIPNLGSLPIREVQPILDLVRADANSFAALSQLGLDTPINQAMQQIPGLQNLKLGNLNLSDYSLLSLDGIKDAVIGKFSGALAAQLSKFLGLDKILLSNFPIPITFAGGVGTVDVVYGEKESKRRNTISGGDQVGFNVPCEKKCSYIELSGNPLVHGKQWISGKSQEVEGGFGLFKFMNGTGKEPTGRFVLGPAFKIVMTEVKESEGTADFTSYWRVCGLGCSPYFIPIPITVTVKEKDMIPLGP
jgi:hypothetical protein